MLPAARKKVYISRKNVYFQAVSDQKYTFFPFKTLQTPRAGGGGDFGYSLKTRHKYPLWGLEPPKNIIVPEREHRKKTPIFLEQNGSDRIGVATPPFSAIPLLQAAHARNTPPPWWINRRRGPRGQRGRAVLGLAGGSGGWLVAGRQGPGAGGWVWRHGAWWHGCMEGNDRFRLIVSLWPLRGNAAEVH